MLYAFFGNDTVRVRERALAFLHELKEGDNAPRTITAEDWGGDLLRDLARGASLFGGTETILLDTLSEGGAEVLEEVVSQLELLKESGNKFVLIEGALSAPVKRQVEKYAETAEEIAGEKESKFNIFLLSDALLRRDKKSLWLLLQEARRAGSENEQIIGMLFWQLKVLRLAEKVQSEEESGQKPFVYQKAKRALQNFAPGDLERLSREPLALYHDGHLGEVDLSTALERWVLTV